MHADLEPTTIVPPSGEPLVAAFGIAPVAVLSLPRGPVQERFGRWDALPR